MDLQSNVGGTDRLVRAVAGTALAVGAGVALAGGAPLLGAGAGILGAALLFNAATQFCGVNALLGIDTCSVEER